MLSIQTAVGWDEEGTGFSCNTERGKGKEQCSYGTSKTDSVTGT